MTERPILFQGAMVRAILDGRKTETRRLAINRHAARVAPGDTLWVRETWTARMTHGWTIADARSRMFQEEILYQADGTESIDGWWPSIHMPREFSRILLRVSAVYVEPLQAITDDAARAEGVEQDTDGWRDYAMPHTQCCATPHDSYRTLWDSINPTQRWERNPDVRVIRFERLTP